MSPNSVLKDGIAPLGTPRKEPDQRLHPRYPIRLDLQYKLLNQVPVNQTGSGRTVNISTGGILFEAHDPLPKHGRIDLAVNWPFLLDGACPLILLVHGRIVRTDAKGIAIKVGSYEFRTSKRSAT